MSTIDSIDSVDRITQDTLKELAGLPGPWITITMPTHRTGAEVREGRIRLRNLATRGIELLGEFTEPDALEATAARLDELRSNHSFWQQQATGLVVLASPQEVRAYRTTANLPEAVRISPAPGLRELALQMDADDTWYIVAFSQKQARLFAATGHSITELPLEDIPAGSDDATGGAERQRHLQWSVQGGRGESRFHGLGGGGENDRVWLEKYLRQVVSGLESHSARPGAAKVVLVGVPSIVAALRSMWRSPALLADSVPGNPDELPPAEIHASTLQLIRAERGHKEQALLERLGGSDRGLLDQGDILRAAAEGRIDELLVGDHADEGDVLNVDTAITDTLRFGGAVSPVHSLPHAMAAISRY